MNPDPDHKTPFNPHILEAVSKHKDIILWAMDMELNVTYYNHLYEVYLYKLKPGAILSYHNGEGYIQTTYREFLNFSKTQLQQHDKYAVTVKIPSGLWLRMWLTKSIGRDGEPVVLGWGSDATLQIITKIAPEESEAKFRHVFETLQDVYFQCATDGEIKMVSPSSIKIVGFTPEELVGKNITDYYLYNVGLKNISKTLLRASELKNFEIALVHKSGKIIPTICNIRLYKGESKWVIEGTAKDIAEIKQTNEELEHAINLANQSLKVKERFLSNMSHEIRTPLNGIIGMVNVLGKSDLSEEQNSQLSAIKQSADILMKLLNNLLDWSKLEAGKAPINYSSIAPMDLLQRVILIYRQKALEHRIKIHYVIDSDVPSLFISDEVKLTQIISNLISNAIKYSPEGKDVIIRLKLVSRHNKLVKLRCEVSDSGPGIYPEEKINLFKSFTQLDNSLTRMHEGAGLGLSISKQLAIIMGGEIDVDSTPGYGSTFWFTFRAEEARDEEVAISKVVRLEKFDTPLHVLVVDDNRINLDIASAILSNAGAVVTKAGSGKMAVEILQKQNFNIVLLDIQMPGMDGFDVLRWMKHNLSYIPPVVALTASGSKEEEEGFLTSGFNDFIGKPIIPEELLLKVKELSTDDVAIVDKKVLKRLAKFGGDEVVIEALNDFYIDTHSQIKECFVSLSEDNHKKILNILHTIKGNAGTLGVYKLARCAGQIEENLKKGYITRLDQELEELEHFFKEFETYRNDKL